RIGDTGLPWGIPLRTGAMSPVRPSRHTAACLLERKLATHLTSGSGIRFSRRTCSSRPWLTKSK
ncbi:hypothetical protein BKA62DRAFT_581694, partial [Auriculariales sp. MPI-PUGE-AT-0066]